jgi:hypothetical protein
MVFDRKPYYSLSRMSKFFPTCENSLRESFYGASTHGVRQSFVTYEEITTRDPFRRALSRGRFFWMIFPPQGQLSLLVRRDPNVLNIGARKTGVLLWLTGKGEAPSTRCYRL